MRRFREGSFQLNPPFVDDLVVPMVKRRGLRCPFFLALRLEECLAEAEAQKKALTFVVVVCAARFWHFRVARMMRRMLEAVQGEPPWDY